ncbi:unnamed protein product [[Actinomadura] parvosata subsp. kistnae]|nr:unnamed protein product [Actinomadura parvosata subsp. kistnae]
MSLVEQDPGERSHEISPASAALRRKIYTHTRPAPLVPPG